MNFFHTHIHCISISTLKQCFKKVLVKVVVVVGCCYGYGCMAVGLERLLLARRSGYASGGILYDARPHFLNVT